ncbi:MAG TPA: dienelactone hydrolase family protein [Myxococcota bacterium]
MQLRTLFASAAILVSTLIALPASAAIKTERVAYKDKAGTTLEGYLAYDDAVTGKRPGIVVVHDWMGIGPFVEEQARNLALQGYVAFAADIYGKADMPKDQKAAAAVAGKYRNGDRTLLRERALAALQTLSKNARVDASKLAAIGFCFGGTTAIELAKSGASLRGVVSFHGGLDAKSVDDSKDIKAKLLVLHGADDPFVPAADIGAFKASLNKAKVDWQLVEYAGTVHAFTQPDAGTDNSKGAAYNERSAKRAFAEMKAFFAEIFG